MSSSRSASRASSSCRSSAAARSAADGMSIPEQLTAIHERATRLVAEQYRCLNELLLPALAAEGRAAARALGVEPAGDRVARAVLRARGRAGALPAGPRPRAPLPAHPEQEPELHRAPVEGKDAFNRDSELAIVQAPRSLPRVVPLPDGGASRGFVLLSTIVQTFVPKLFTGIRVMRLLPVPRHAQQRPVRRRRGNRRPARARSRASSRTAATATRCGSRPRTTAPRTW